MPTTNAECIKAAEVMNAAGYDQVVPDMVRQVFNQWNTKVFVAVLGNSMVVYTPEWDDDPIKLVVF